jgi:fumarylpyruvate hydrolase
MIWTVPEIISELSKLFELHAGDMIFTGTPSGVGPVQPGDRLRAAIERVGELTLQVCKPS